MNRLRLVFAAVAVALLVPVTLIVRVTLEAVAIERAQEHEAVADRVFEEMQRALETLLDEEERRPPGQYKKYFVPSGDTTLTRSPLADLPYPPYVLGYFELDENRTFQTPLVETSTIARDERAARLASLQTLVRDEWPPGERLAFNVPAQQFSEPEPPKKKASKRKRADTQSTVALKGQLPRKGKNIEEPDVFESLKQIGSTRLRQQKRAPVKFKTSPKNVYNLDSESSLNDGGLVPRQQEQRRAPPPPSTIDVNVDPMMGRVLGDARLALYRTVWSAEGSVRQGVVIDVAALGTWLQAQTIADTDFADLITVRTGLNADVGRELDGDYVFQRQFLEPFGALRAAVAMPTLPGGSEGGIWLLTLMVVLAATVGLFFAYRMVAARMAYAERRSNFVSAVTHELKTPLTVIRMYSEMLEGDMLTSDEKRREYYRTIGAESDRLGRLINNVLELSKIEQGNRQLELVSGSVQSVLDDVLEMLRPHADATGFALEVRCDPDLPAIRYDRDALVQIVFNLVDNAMKYARDAERRVVVLEARRGSVDVELKVRDFGPGVPAVHLKRVFEPFYRPENELTRTSKGTGIGLALVKNLAEGMGGSVEGRNPSDGGFEVTVGLAPAA
ncbi:MAG: HAMP domain-containing sensor histidine kinase [Myxococcota bacterium]